MLVRVFEVPPPTGEFLFAGGKDVVFHEVDWFRDDELPAGGMGTEHGQMIVEEFVKGKRYIDPNKAYLVLAQAGSFTINYIAP